MPPPAAETAPCLVMGGAEDIIMDRDGCQETAEWCRGELVFLPNLAHDMMLVRCCLHTHALGEMSLHKPD